MNTFIKYSLFFMFSICLTSCMLRVLKIAENDCTDGPEMCYKVMFLGSEILTMCHDTVNTGNSIWEQAIKVSHRYLNIIVDFTKIFLDSLDNWRAWVYDNVLDVINGRKEKSILESIFSFIKSRFSTDQNTCKLCELFNLNDKSMERVILKFPTCTAALITKFIILFINPIPAIIGLFGYTLFTYCFLPLQNRILKHQLIKKYSCSKTHIS